MSKIELPPERKKDIESSIALSHDLDDFLNRAAASGRDVSELKKSNAESRRELTKIKQAFFPNS